MVEARISFCCALALSVALLAPTPAPAATQISSARVWPAHDYTRVTLESETPIRHQMLLLKNPERMVVDLDDVAITPALEGLAARIGAADPYVKAVRIGRFKPGTVRLVFDLKVEAKPEVFTLRPIAEYGHRLVLDIYPAQAVDPLIALLDKSQSAAITMPGEIAAPPETVRPTPEPAPTKAAPGPAKPPNQRLIVVVIDAGHGGEDPGAKGRGGTYEKHITLA